MATMKAVLVHGFEGPDKWEENTSYGEKPKPAPGPGEVLVNIRLRPLNPADVFSIQGVYPGFQPPKFPAVPGLEGVGVVDKLGEGVTEFHKGQRVVPFLLNDYVKIGEGSWQEYVAVKEEDVVAVPDSLDDQTAAQFVVNPLTVLGMLNKLDVPAGETLLQTAAGSVLGRMLIQVAHHKGIKTINIVRRSEQKEELKAIGADHVISSSDEDVVARVKEITGGRGAYAAVECVAGDTMQMVASSVRDEATVLLYGAMGAFTFSVRVPDVLFRGVVIKGFWVSPYIQSLSKEAKHKFFADTMKLLEEKVMEPYHGEVYELADFKKALEKQKTIGRGGKLLLRT